MLAMLVFMALLAAGLFYLFLKVDFIPNPASEERVLIDHLMQVLFAIASVFFSIIVTVFGYALLFFRGQAEDETDAKPIQGSAPLEVAWTVIPLIIVIVLSIYGANILDQMTAVNPDASKTQTVEVNPGATLTQTVYSLGAFIPREFSTPDAASANATSAASSNTTAQPELIVNVTAQRFVWSFSYPQYSINTTYQLEVPVNRRILFHIQALDVIHSFWVQAWGPKQDAVPGLSPDLRITPTKLGDFTVQCNQLCGFGHTNMQAPVSVVSEADFNAWVQQQTGPTVTSTPPPGSVSFIELSAKNKTFDQTTLTVAAGSKVQILFTNHDMGVQENFSVYASTGSQTAIFKGKIITGSSSITYEFTAPTKPGSYYFQCDEYPNQMNGTFVVK